MELRLERDGQQVTLRLKKNDNVRDDVPVYISDRNIVRQVDKSKMPVSNFYHLRSNILNILEIKVCNFLVMRKSIAVSCCNM